MATSGTTTFNLNIDDIIQEGYQRCNITTSSGYELKSARTSLNLLFADWGNRGIHLWKVELDEKQLVSGQASYTVDSDVSDVLEAFISTTSTAANSSSTQDVALTKIDRSTYAALPNKYSTGTPSQYYVSRQTTPVIYLYQAPNLTTYTYVKYYVIKRIEDAGAYTNQADVVYRFLPCMCAGLAYYLSMKVAPQLVQQNKLIYEDELKRALEEDGQRTSTFITPQSFYPTTGI
jgi:hypothetical protein|tara:strand:+ start:1446 stop:2144 length:699 start_codon:yes stop_codon:yes gene_type:complete